MIVILKQNAEQNEVNALLKQLEEMGFDHHYSKGENSAIVGISVILQLLTQTI